MEKGKFVVELDCPISNKKEAVFFAFVKGSNGWELRSNGCDTNWSGAPECLECEKRGIAILKGDAEEEN